MTASKPQTATLIDMLGEGYAVVNRRPWLLILPLLLNLYLVFGAPLSFAPLLDSLSGLMQRMQPPGSDPAMVEQFADMAEQLGRQDMRRPLAVLNVVPTLPPVREVAADDPSALRVSGVGGALLAFVLINTLALPLSALFLVLTGQAVRGERARQGLLRATGRVALAMLTYIGVLAGVGIGLGLPYVFLSVMLMLLSPPLGLLAAMVLQLVSFWAWIYIGFANEAIVIGEQGPLGAIRASFNLVRHNFWSTLGFLALSAFIIPLGMGIVWQSISGTTFGLVASAIGSAYIGCGLAAARMIFYRERIRRWRGAPAYAGTGR